MDANFKASPLRVINSSRTITSEKMYTLKMIYKQRLRLVVVSLLMLLWIDADATERDPSHKELSDFRPNITSINGTKTVCYGTTVTYDATVTDGASCQSNKWTVSGGGTIIGSSTSPEVTVKWTSSGSLTYTVGISWACEESSGVIHGTDSHTANVTVRTTSSPTITGGGGATACKSATLTFYSGETRSYWQYRVTGGSWSSSFGPSSSLNFKFSDHRTDADLGKVLEFRSWSYPSGCTSGTKTYSPTTASRTFYQDAPSNFNTSFVAQSSKCESNAEVTISNLTYPNGGAYNKEAIEIEFVNSSNTKTYTFSRSGLTGYKFNSSTADDGGQSPRFDNSETWTVVITTKPPAGTTNSCSSFPGKTITFPAPAAFAFQSTYPKVSQSITCNTGSDSGSKSDGRIEARVSNGKAAYTYKIFKSGTEITAKRATTSANNHIFTGLGAGSYTVQVLDACVSPYQSILNSGTISLSEPAVISVGGTPIDETCNGTPNDGSIDAIVSGGTAPYTYQWSGGSTATTQDLTNIAGSAAGITYTLTVTDSKSCTKSKSYTVKEPSALSVTGTPVNETCAGTPNNGSINATVSGGTAPYSYQWSGGSTATTQDLSNIAGSVSGTAYTLTVTDSKGCTKAQSFTVYEPTAITIAGTVTNTTCSDLSNGSIDITSVIGGTGSYTYSWSNGRTVADISGLAGSVTGIFYTLTVTDGNGCSANKTFKVTAPAAITVVANVQDELCNGTPNDGSIDVTSVTGGTAPYTYQWSGGSTVTTQDLSNISGSVSGTTYELTVTDANSCSVTKTYVVREPYPLLADATLSDFNGEGVSCKGSIDGFVNLDVSGGTSPYSYNWSNGATTKNISGLGAGIYSVTITDDNNCEITLSNIEITEPPALTFSLQSQTNVDCNGNSTGSVIFSATGGNGALEYSIDNGATYQSSNVFTGMAAATYQAKVRDVNLCEKSLSVTITEPAVLITTASKVNVTCFSGTDGSITVLPSGGAGGNEFSLDGGAYQTSATFSDLSAGTYNLTVKDANGCTANTSATVGTPSPISGSVVLNNPISCNGDSDGSISISASGGTGTFTYLWSTGETTQAITGLSAANYNVTVTDQNSCTKTFNYTLGEPTILKISDAVLTDVSCNGGSSGAINITVAGGTAPYNYSWSEGSSSQDITALSAAGYDVTVTDSRGCSVSGSYTISEPTLLTAVIDQQQEVSCKSGSDGSVTVLAVGGTGTYEYSIGGANWQSSSTFNSLTAGGYTFDIRDSNGCLTSVGTTITEPTVITVTIQNIEHTTCGEANGGAESVVAGGVPPYLYSWKNGANAEIATTPHLTGAVSDVYTLEVTDDNGCAKLTTVAISNTDGADLSIGSIVPTSCNTSEDGQATVTITGGIGPFEILWDNSETTLTATSLSGGSHTVAVTDANNCTVYGSVVIPQPDAIGFTLVSEQRPSCFGESDAVTEISATGGSGTYTYSWSNGQTGPVLSMVTAGIYEVVIKDDNGCNDTFEVTVNETPALSVQVVEQSSPSCVGGADGVLEITGQGGTAPYTYDWGSFGASARLENISAGSYSVTVTDANNCTFTTAVQLDDPEQIGYTIVSMTEPTCKGESNGSVEIAGTGGSGPFTYLWDNGDNDNRLQSVAAGDYGVTITDNKGCSNYLTVTVTEPAVLNVSVVTHLEPTCNGFSDGQLIVEATGGTSPYFFNWSNGITGTTIGSLRAGTYTVDVQDDRGCTTSMTINLAEPDQLMIDVVDYVLPTCHDSEDGILEIDAQGGTGAYSINWNTGASTKRIINLLQNDYEVVVTDANNCSISQIIALTGVEPITIDANITDPLCHGYADGEIVLTTTGGTGALQYLWDSGSTSSSITNLSSGDYTVTVTDENNCSETQNISLTDPAEIVVDLGDGEMCEGGSYPVGLNLGSGYSYTWTADNGFSASSGDVVLTSPGIYTVTATDQKGCRGTDDFTLSTNNDLLNADFIMATEAYVGDTVIMIDISWPIPDQLSWQIPDGATVLMENQDYAEVVFGTAGSYTMDIEVGLGNCLDYYSQTINILERKADNSGGRTGEEKPLITKFTPYPSPNDGIFWIDVELSRVEDIRLTMVDLQGNKVVYDQVYDQQDYYKEQILLPQLRPGIYLLTLNTAGESRIIRVMVK